MRALGLPCRLLFGQAARRDVGSDHHLREAAIHPVQVARAHLQPLAQFGAVDFRVLGAGAGQRVGGQAHQPVLIVHAGGLLGGQHAGLGHQLQMAIGLRAKPLAIQAVGKQQLGTAQGRHRHRCVQRLQHHGEAFVRRGELFADAVGLGDVGHRRHPAGLLALGIHQRRHIQTGVEQRSALALHACLKAAGHALAREFIVGLGLKRFLVRIGPVGVGRHLAHQVGFAPAGHLAERGIHIGDTALHVHRAHAREHGVFHGAAEVGLGHQRLLRLQAPARVTPGGDQQPRRHHR
ncbi:hypothetical protein SDC9_160922 [bioreactor metagenome]|uniref:Uncharacterized protein n=1 Tax=bioreactor metagenome TaxID=1076179 RepID=A0A645FI12_9ZZZZ